MYAFQVIKKLVLISALLMIMSNHVRALESFSSHPVRIWGDISTVYRDRDIDGGDSSATERLNTGTVNASTFIWRPWFALLRGGLTLSEDTSDFTGQETVKDKFLTGNLQFDLFPSSRFPFQLYYNQSRNELDDQVFDREIITTEYGFGQQYRTENGKHHYRTNYKQNERDDSKNDRFTVESLFFSSNNQFTNQSIDTDIQFDTVNNDVQDEEANSYSVTGRHSYSDSVNFSIENLVSTSEIENDFLQSESNAKTAQISSLLAWRPQGRDDINLTGSFRLSDIEFTQTQDNTTVSNEQINTESSIANLNQGLIYNYSERLRIFESVNASYIESGSQEQFAGSESIGVSYTPDRILWDSSDYGWSISSSFNNQHGDIESSQSLNNQFSHSLTNDFSAQDKYDLRTSLTQSLNYDYQSELDDERSTDHAFSVTWSGSSVNNQSVLRFLISDSRSLDRTDSSLQLANLQYSGFFRLNRFSQIIGNLTFQKSKQIEGSEQSERTVSNGQLEYSRERLFQVPRLRFKSRLKFSEQQSESEQFLADLNEEAETDSSWENSLHYRIGRLEAQLNLDFIKADNEVDRLIKIQITRSFGDL